jgi:aminoglycoside phosphotransferase (APT) family kinase protein
VKRLGVDTAADFIGRWLPGRDVSGSRTVAGGVSSIVVRSRVGASGDVVLKQPLERLNVDAEWRCDPARVLNEAKALTVTQALLPPGSVPAVLGVDAENLVLMMEAAPAGAASWKERLLAGEVSTALASAAGEILAALQVTTWDQPRWESAFPSGGRYFQELRLSPYFDFAGRRNHDLAAEIEAARAAAQSPRRCLVHGDFAPKNLLVIGSDRLMLIDWEVVHYGSPRFDPAFLLTHLSLKAVHGAPHVVVPYLEAARRFWEAYQEGLGAGRVTFAEVAPVLAGLVLARVDGKSPAEYLTEAERRVARRFAMEELRAPAADIDGYLARLKECASA